MMRVVKCCAKGCSVTYQSVPQRTFSIVPRFDKKRRRIWLKNVGRDDLNKTDNTSRYWVCSDHFSENQFANTLKSRLRKFAVPDILCLPYNRKTNLLSADEDGLPTPVNKVIHGPLVIELAMPLKSDLPNKDEVSSKSDNLTYIEVPLNSDQFRISQFNCGALFSKSSSNTPGEEILQNYNPNSSNHNPTSDCDENEDNSEETLAEQFVLEKVKANLCRVCGCPGGSLTPILEETGTSLVHGLPLVKVLEIYLPLKVSSNDSFPLSICSSCHETLGEWHQFYLTCVAANESFKNLFGRRENRKASSSADNNSSVCKDTGIIKSSRNDHNYVKNELEEMDQDFEECEDNINAYDSNELSVDKSVKKQSCKAKFHFCKFCRQSYCNRNELKDHVQLCKEEPTLCDLCGKLVQHRKLLSAHKYKEHNYYLRVCDKCGKSVPSKHFSRHCDAFHSGSYYCNLCCTVLCSKTLYNVHMRKHYKGEIKSCLKIDPFPCDGGVYLYQCPMCEELFKDLPNMIIHLNEPKVVRCPTCNIKFNNEKRLAIHTCKKWECRFCSKFFFIRERFMEHERIHTGQKPFKCNFCCASFRKKHQRIVHEKTHGAPSHECKYCGKKFKLVTSLRSHINAHEGVFFSCAVCEKKFPGENYLQRHMKTHESAS